MRSFRQLEPDRYGKFSPEAERYSDYVTDDIARMESGRHADIWMDIAENMQPCEYRGEGI